MHLESEGICHVEFRTPRKALEAGLHEAEKLVNQWLKKRKRRPINLDYEVYVTERDNPLGEIGRVQLVTNIRGKL